MLTPGKNNCPKCGELLVYNAAPIGHSINDYAPYEAICSICKTPANILQLMSDKKSFRIAP
jgi:hypothetical protein